MSFFTKTDTYRITITDPDSQETAEVELRPLNAGDQAMFSDTIAMTGDQEPSVRLGSLRLLMVERAIVSWTLDVSPTRASIEQLTIPVFEQIFEAVNAGESPPLDEKPSQSKRKS